MLTSLRDRIQSSLSKQKETIQSIKSSLSKQKETNDQGGGVQIMSFVRLSFYERGV